jgi:hypothetical protein
LLSGTLIDLIAGIMALRHTLVPFVDNLKRNRNGRRMQKPLGQFMVNMVVVILNDGAE